MRTSGLHWQSGQAWACILYRADMLMTEFFCLQAFEHLQSFIAECDRKMESSKKRLKETQEELSEEATAKVCSVSIYLHLFV